MKKIITLINFILLVNVFIFAAYEGGTVSCEPGISIINPGEPVVITYDGTGTNFTNWSPQCHAHLWLIGKDGIELESSYTTKWIDFPNSGVDYWHLVPDNQKMTKIGSGNTGIYSISIDNLYEYFDVKEADKSNIGQLGIIVRASYKGDSNRTETMYLSVEDPIFTNPYTTLTISNRVFLDEEITFEATSLNITDPVYTYSVKTPLSNQYVPVESSPYQPTEVGTYTFKVEAAAGADEGTTLAKDEKEVVVKDPETAYIVRVKTAEVWEEVAIMSIHFWNDENPDINPTTNPVPMTKDGEWWKYRFYDDISGSVNVIFLNGNSWTNDKGLQTANILGVDESTCFQINDTKDADEKRTYNIIDCITITDSYIYVGSDPETAKWYNAQGNGDETEGSFEGNIGTFTTFLQLGGEIQTNNFSDVSSKIHYQITNNDTGNKTVFKSSDFEMPWIGNPSIGKDLWKSLEGENILEGLNLSNGEYGLEVWFTAESGRIIAYDSKYNANYTATFTINKGTTSLDENLAYISIFTINNQIQAVFEGTKQIMLYSISGQLIHSDIAVNQFSYNINTGIYILQIDNEVYKVIVNK